MSPVIAFNIMPRMTVTFARFSFIKSPEVEYVKNPRI